MEVEIALPTAHRHGMGLQPANKMSQFTFVLGLGSGENQQVINKTGLIPGSSENLKLFVTNLRKLIFWQI